ncbi:DUF4181 domain-containing protein [Planococcus sp. ISL-110]|uniref:DUF4181 domain-containing protein n=1 Tax=Planococcus sp. ISL-110 TaxID=2819167 RepID=UPI001BE65812|nr:DUF4181 domain-containing protein [Planococcus sp. ISL-110]
MVFEDVGWRVVLFLFGTLSSIFLVNLSLRKILGVQRRKFFSTEHVNDLHKKWDRILNVGAGIVVFIMSFALIEYGPVISMYILIITAVIGTLQILIRAGFEKNHAENPNDYMYTLLEALAGTVILITFGVSLFRDFVSVIFNI